MRSQLSESEIRRNHMSTEAFPNVPSLKKTATERWLFVVAYVLVALSLLPALASALIAIISLIVGNETSVVDYLRELSILFYPLLAAVSLCTSWIQRVNQERKKSWILISNPFVFIAFMLMLDCHPFISLFILPTLFSK